MAAEGTDPAQRAGLLRQMDDIGTRFLARTQPEIDAWSARLAAPAAGSGEVLAELELFAHRVHGSSAIFGFMALSHHAGLLEAKVRELRGVPVDAAAIAGIAQLFSAVAAQCRQAMSERTG